VSGGPTFADRRRLLQLETLYDLALALHAERGEQELLDELLARVCAVLDPAAAVAVTRDGGGGVRAVATVGWQGAPPAGAALLEQGLWRELLAEGQSLARRDGALAGRPFRDLLAAPLAWRGVFLGYLALLDKESRGEEEAAPFSVADRRFLDSVAALAAVTLDEGEETFQVNRRLIEIDTRRLRLLSGNRRRLFGHPRRRKV